MIEAGYVTSQTVAIRRLCDGRRDVISLRRVLMEFNSDNTKTRNEVSRLLSKLVDCDHVCEMVNNFVAHTANPDHQKHGVGEWNLRIGHLTDAQRAICEVAIKFDRDILRRRNRVKVMPVPSGRVMEEFEPWVPADDIQKLWNFWHAHDASVNAWMPA